MQRIARRITGAIALVGFRDHATRADIIVVPGNTVQPDGTVSARLQSRLDVALQLFHEGLATAIFVNAALYLRTHQLHSAIVATQYFHVARTTLALERSGVRVAGTRHARYFELRDAYSLFREVLGYAAYWARD